jgi:hypothetical protein
MTERTFRRSTQREYIGNPRVMPSFLRNPKKAALRFLSLVLGKGSSINTLPVFGMKIF